MEVPINGAAVPFRSQYSNFPTIVNGSNEHANVDRVHSREASETAGHATHHEGQALDMRDMVNSLPSPIYNSPPQAIYGPPQYTHYHNQYYTGAPTYPQTRIGGSFQSVPAMHYPHQQAFPQPLGQHVHFQPRGGFSPSKDSNHVYQVPHAGYQAQQSPIHNYHKVAHAETARSGQRYRASLGQITATYAKPPQAHMFHSQPMSPNMQSATFSSQAAATIATSILDANANVVPRGPPRKPRQSGHALWVGNLPLNVTVVDLKDHFSRGATNDIESLKLISKSNCAFVNYKTHASCVAALERFQDSIFHGTKLVCRLRRSSVIEQTSQKVPQPESIEDNGTEEADEGVRTSSLNPSPSEKLVAGATDCFFVLKSLTLEDLITSVQSSSWSTQPHNEVLLNNAYKSAKNVYLFFSVNKSGEYFGYARMASPIHKIALGTEGNQADQTDQVARTDQSGGHSVNGDSPSTVVLGSTSSALGAIPAPQCIPTPRTQWAPRGHIIDDLARGTIFWEADSDNLEDGRGNSPSKEESTESRGEINTAPAPRKTSNFGHDVASFAAPNLGEQVSGNTFAVEWVSITKLPFHKTRGLRNPLNGNREVKIARDGTQISADIGTRLMELFSAS